MLIVFNSLFKVRAQLAKKALDAAKITEAALAGKQALVEQLKEESKETQSVVKESKIALQRAHENLNFAIKSVHDSRQQVMFINNLYNNIILFINYKLFLSWL